MLDSINRSPRFAAWCIALILAAGCSPGTQRAAPVDPQRARLALTTAMESWKKGDLPSALEHRQPLIIVQDMEWEAGRTLVDFEIVGDGKAEDANLRCRVLLTFQESQGKQLQETVSYVVGTSPFITVFREIMP